uniref:Uncharacterized protein n=1 Tax=Coccidioides posadasii RMSCC 3488 TaxID=454284 RepID=A0A0J6IHM6_COCPO|nr:hypothetical protein CPAG_07644 [Coccidioides posadasii RMSCC 3488]
MWHCQSPFGSLTGLANQDKALSITWTARNNIKVMKQRFMAVAETWTANFNVVSGLVGRLGSKARPDLGQLLSHLSQLPEALLSISGNMSELHNISTLYGVVINSELLGNVKIARYGRGAVRPKGDTTPGTAHCFKGLKALNRKQEEFARRCFVLGSSCIEPSTLHRHLRLVATGLRVFVEYGEHFSLRIDPVRVPAGVPRTTSASRTRTGFNDGENGAHGG